MVVGLAGGVLLQPVGGVPVLVTKLHDPPVGVPGLVALSKNMRYSKYVPPRVAGLPYKPAVSAPVEAATVPVALLP
jgi:hypothetical protein